MCNFSKEIFLYNDKSDIPPNMYIYKLHTKIVDRKIIKNIFKSGEYKIFVEIFCIVDYEPAVVL